MSAYFLDTSALVKRYISEAGTTWIRNLTRTHANNDILIARITQTEVTSAVYRRHRGGNLTLKAAKLLRATFSSHSTHQYLIVEISQSVVERASDYSATYPLRAYDAVQLAAAFEANQRLISQALPALTLLASDKKLLTAAIAEGLTVDDPNNYS